MPRWAIWLVAVVLFFGGRWALATIQGKGLTPVEAAQLAAAAVDDARGDGALDREVVLDRLHRAFGDHRPRFRGSDGTPFSPITRSGAWVRNIQVEDGAVRVALEYADARADHGGDIFCIFVTVPGNGPSEWVTEEARMDQPDGCPL